MCVYVCVCVHVYVCVCVYFCVCVCFSVCACVYRIPEVVQLQRNKLQNVRICACVDG